MLSSLILDTTHTEFARVGVSSDINNDICSTERAVVLSFAPPLAESSSYGLLPFPGNCRRFELNLPWEVINRVNYGAIDISRCDDINTINGR